MTLATLPLVLSGAAALGYLVRMYEAAAVAKVKSAFNLVGAKESAFGKLAAADAKIAEAKAQAAAKKAEALAVHDSIDEVHKILG